MKEEGKRFDELLEKLRQNNPEITEIYLDHNNSVFNLDLAFISDKEMTALAGALTNNTTVQELVLTENERSGNPIILGLAGARALADLITTNTSLKSLQFQAHEENYQEIKFHRGLIDICHAIRNNESLEKLDLSGNYLASEFSQITDSAGHTKIDYVRNAQGQSALDTLFESLTINTTLQEINLGRNGITTDVLLEQLAAVLKTNNSLKKLDLQNTLSGNDYSSVTDRGLLAIIDALNKNTALTHVKLPGITKINEAGLIALADFIKHNKTLDELHLSLREYKHFSQASETVKAAFKEALSVNTSIKVDFGYFNSTRIRNLVGIAEQTKAERDATQALVTEFENLQTTEKASELSDTDKAAQEFALQQELADPDSLANEFSRQAVSAEPEADKEEADFLAAWEKAVNEKTLSLLGQAEPEVLPPEEAFLPTVEPTPLKVDFNAGYSKGGKEARFNELLNQLIQNDPLKTRILLTHSVRYYELDLRTLNDTLLEKLAGALRENTKVKQFSLIGDDDSDFPLLKMKLRGCQALATMLIENRSLRSFTLQDHKKSFTYMGFQRGLVDICHAIRYSSVTTLDLQGNKLGSKFIASAIAGFEGLTEEDKLDSELYASVPALLKKDASRNFSPIRNDHGQSALEVLCESLIINGNLQEINLGLNDIGSDNDMMHIADLLRNTSLKRLHLPNFTLTNHSISQKLPQVTSTEITSVGLLEILEALKHNTSLTHLTLPAINVRDEQSLIALANTIKHNESLSELIIPLNAVNFIHLPDHLQQVFAEALSENTSIKFNFGDNFDSSTLRTHFGIAEQTKEERDAAKKLVVEFEQSRETEARTEELVDEFVQQQKIPKLNPDEFEQFEQDEAARSPSINLDPDEFVKQTEQDTGNEQPSTTSDTPESVGIDKEFMRPLTDAEIRAIDDALYEPKPRHIPGFEFLSRFDERSNAPSIKLPPQQPQTRFGRFFSDVAESARWAAQTLTGDISHPSERQENPGREVGPAQMRRIANLTRQISGGSGAERIRVLQGPQSDSAESPAPQNGITITRDHQAAATRRAASTTSVAHEEENVRHTLADRRIKQF